MYGYSLWISTCMLTPVRQSNPSSNQPASRTSIPCHLLRIAIKVHVHYIPRLPPSHRPMGMTLNPVAAKSQNETCYY
ncbi:hypothetical protein I7I48_05029 [Histoplasma ohiense]|nr:hypothetical protein I7I48_05029 [Histoplasma ohiense (nom. inval.)]